MTHGSWLFLPSFRMYTMDKPSMLGPPGSVLVSSKLNMQQLHQRAANIPPMVSHHGNLPQPPHADAVEAT